MRVYPHLQDSGGFFVAVLERRDQTPALEPQPRFGSVALEGTNAHICNHTGRKRAKETSEAPQPKRPRLEEKIASGSRQAAQPITSANAFEAGTPGVEGAESMEVEVEKATTPAVDEVVNGGKVEVFKSSGNESFKENPYTFLAPDDPILASCMCVPFERYFEAR
jgi:multisite-specific tRNA:(cytosine-C5)-methyltransferase